METIDLSTLATLLEDEGVLAHTINLDDPVARSTVVTGADCDSRVVEPGHLFICKGRAFREAFLASALQAGAVAYLADTELAPMLEKAHPTRPALVVSDVRRAMAVASAACWGHPDRTMPIAGITGTKGKTTVAAFLRSILDGERLGSGAAIIGTLETYDGRERMVSRNTTPEAPDLWRYLAHAREAGLACVMEVSSQGLKYQRVEGLSFDVCAFLNIGIDHVSAIEHPTFDDYLESKLKIFAQSRVAVVSSTLDPAHAERIMAAAECCERIVTFGLDEGADVFATDITATPSGLRFEVHTPTWAREAEIGLTGTFNVENALAAVAIACELGCDSADICAGLARCRVPGRMEMAASADGRVTTVVDYAHNGMAVSTAMSQIRASYPDHFVVCVFGATGGKGAERRFEMPPAAAPYADHLVFTEDDAGPEPVDLICAQMLEATPEGTKAEVVLDRTEAIRHALALARASERPSVVCVLGKGHEARQLRATGPVPITPDPQLVRELLREL